MQWAHSKSSAASPQKIMGQSKPIGSSSKCQCNGPTLIHWQYILEKEWAKAKLLAMAAANALGQS
jgi:hypothetical protein